MSIHPTGSEKYDITEFPPSKLPSPRSANIIIFLTCGVCFVTGILWRKPHRDLEFHEKLIDLSYSYDMNTAVWPGDQPFRYIRQDTEYLPPTNDWYASNDFMTAEHCGTHLDAPYHFNKDGWKVADIPVERFFTVAAFVNATEETNGNPQYTLPASKLREWEEKNGPLPDNSVILVSFGWSSRYGNKTAYLGPNGTLLFPGLSKEAAEWIVKTKKVVGVGVDTASVDQGDNRIAHVILQRQDLYILENVAMNCSLPPLFKIVVLPMKLANGTGAPCRVVALV